jgi:hypothetical protein
MWTCLVRGIQVADIENVGLNNSWEITINKYFNLSKRELSEAIKNDIKEANESSRMLT